MTDQKATDRRPGQEGAELEGGNAEIHESRPFDYRRESTSSKSGFDSSSASSTKELPHTLAYTNSELLGNERQVEAPGFLDVLLGKKKFVGELDAIATQPSVFDDPTRAKFYQPHSKWENLHRFNPAARWTWREEQKVIRKVDLYIAVWAVVMFFCLDLDRGNISQANSDNLLKDLGLTTADYNLGNTLFRLCFLIAELPSQMISKKIGSDVWVPTQLVLWSAFSAAQFGMRGRAQFLFFRAMIGGLQGGFIADVILYLSYFYKKTELPFRLACFWQALYLTDLLAPLMSFGILRMRGLGGYAGWRYLFLIEGLFTLVIGLFSFVMMPAAPTKTKTWFWRNGWFTEREEEIMVNRVIRDDPGKGGMHNRQGLTLKALWKSLLDYDLWPLYLVGLTFGLPSYPIQAYLTLQLRELGFDTFETNLLCMPAAAVGMVLLFGITLLSERVNNRTFVAAISNMWYLPCFIALYLLPADGSRWAYWTVATLIVGAPYVHAIQVSLVSRQAGSVRTRTVASAVYNMFVQASAIIGSNVYQPSDAPRYRRANLALIFVSVFNILLYTAVFFYYRMRNASRDKKWKALTKEQQLEYLATTKDEGNRRLDFRFAY